MQHESVNPHVSVLLYMGRTRGMFMKLKPNIERIRRMAEEGLCYSDIAKQIGVDRKCLRKFCKANGIVVKPKPKCILDETTAIRVIEERNNEWEYVGGYTGTDGFAIIKHKVCGYTTRKSFPAIRHGNEMKCLLCEMRVREEKQKALAKQREKEAELREFKKKPKRTEQIQMKECPVCGCFFYSRNKYCSDACVSEARKHYDNMKKEKRRRLSWTEESKTITLSKLYERDNGVCWLCGKQCNYDTDSNSNDYPSIDHVIPIAHGGKDEWANIRLAHRGCNMLKGVKIVEGNAVEIAP